MSSEDGLIDILRINPNAILVMDSDRGCETEELEEQKVKIKDACTKNGVFVWITSGREIENYIPGNVIKAACKDLRETEIDIKFEKFDEFEKILDRALKKSGVSLLDYGKHKREYARKFAAHFEKENIDNELQEKINEIVLQRKVEGKKG
jgi:hypothetical protein